MTLKEIVSHLLLVGQNLKLGKDTRLSERHLQFLVHDYRARGIREEYSRNLQIDPIWIQDYGNTEVTVVNSADDPAISDTSRCISKVTLPDIVSLSNDRGIYRISTASRLTEFYPTTEANYYALTSGEVGLKFNWYWRLGNAYYFTTKEKYVRPFLILGNPMDGYVLQTEWVESGNLTVGQSYTVYNTQIVHNSVSYNPGDTFTAANTVFTTAGTGKVKFTNMKRAMTINDAYPMGRTLLEYVTIKIFTNEFGIAKQQVADIIDDSQDQTLLLQNEDSVRRSRQEKEG